MPTAEGRSLFLMPRRFLCGDRILGITAVVLLVGCGSLTTRQHPPAGQDAAVLRRQASERSAERIAQAHAHFAAAVIHEMNEETEAALEEFYKSAFDDVGNEGLVLDVTRRLLQNKWPAKALGVLTRTRSQT